MNNVLVDDCILHVMSYLHVLKQAELAEFNDRFKALAAINKHKLVFRAENIGQQIGVMNFRYLLELFGATVEELIIYADSFMPTSFGILCNFSKDVIVHCILNNTGENLRKVTFVDFVPYSCEMLQKFTRRNVEVYFN